MPIRVPIAQPTIGQVEAPPDPVSNRPAVPEAAFGTLEAKGIQQTGEAVGKIGDVLATHMIKRAQQEQRAQVIDADTHFRQDIQDAMYSQEPKLDDSGNPTSLPKGVFNRQLGDAKGATVDFDNQYQDLRKNYIDRFTNPVQQEEIAKLMDENYSHHRDLVIHHEATQDRDNQKHIVAGNLRQMVLEAGNLSDPKAFLEQVQTGHDRQYANMKENGYDDASIAAATDTFTADMADKAIMPLVQSTPTAALDYLGKISSVLTPTVRANLTEKIETESRQRAQLEKYQKEQSYDANMRSAMLDMFDGKLTLSEAERRFRDDTLKKSDYDILESKLVKPDYQILREMAVSDPSTFTQVRQAQLDGTKTPGEISRMIAQGNADGKITSDDAKYLDKMTKDVPPDPRDKLVASHAKSVEDFGNRYFGEYVGDYLPMNVPGVSDIPVKKEESEKEVQGLMADFYQRVDKEQATGARVGEIAHEVMGSYVKKRYPEMNRLTDLPHVVVGIDGKIQRLLAPGQNTKLTGQYKVQRNAASKDFEETTGTPPKVEKPK